MAFLTLIQYDKKIIIRNLNLHTYSMLKLYCLQNEMVNSGTISDIRNITINLWLNERREKRRHNLLFTRNSLFKISSNSPKLRKSPRVKISRKEDSRVAQFATYRPIWQPSIQATRKNVIFQVRQGIPQYQLTTARLPRSECRSTERGSQGFIPFLKTRIVFSETIENRTVIHMIFFHQYDMTNQFPEGMTFFMNHPVYILFLLFSTVPDDC